MKLPACTRYSRHRFEWVGDVTLTTIKVNMKRRGQYICECGQRRHGKAQSGL
jgi:hypothetical protein